LPIVVERNDIPIGMEGQLALHTMLMSLLLLECGIDRLTTGTRHVAALLTGEQRAVLAQVATLAPTMDSLIQGRIIYGHLFLPRARRLGQVYPEAFEEATRRHLWETPGYACDVAASVTKAAFAPPYSLLSAWRPALFSDLTDVRTTIDALPARNTNSPRSLADDPGRCCAPRRL
jgi:hypothetical protein